MVTRLRLDPEESTCPEDNVGVSLLLVHYIPELESWSWTTSFQPWMLMLGAISSKTHSQVPSPRAAHVFLLLIMLRFAFQRQSMKYTLVMAQSLSPVLPMISNDQVYYVLSWRMKAL